MRKYLIAVGALLVLGIGTAIATAAIPDADGYTYICVNNSSGTMQAREKGASCPKNSTASRLVANQNAINITNYRKNATFLTAPNGAVTSGNVSCDGNDLATGGGFSTDDKDLHPVSSVPIPFDPPVTGWHFAVRNDEASTLGRNVQVWVVCQHTS